MAKLNGRNLEQVMVLFVVTILEVREGSETKGTIFVCQTGKKGSVCPLGPNGGKREASYRKLPIGSLLWEASYKKL